MPSLTTVYRAIVMFASGVIIVMGWQYYGPSAVQVRAMAQRAAEIGQETWSRIHSSEGPGRTVPAESYNNPLAVAPQHQAGLTSLPKSAESEIVPRGFTSDAEVSSPVVEAPPMFSQAAPPESRLASDSQIPSNLAVTDAMALTMLLTRLKELGGIDPALEPWGTSGDLYRFRCRATLADTPQVTRHFEAVAAEQLVAVENVVAKVQSWRAERVRGQHR
jgi:hypothetical protein